MIKKILILIYKNRFKTFSVGDKVSVLRSELSISYGQKTYTNYVGIIESIDINDTQGKGWLDVGSLILIGETSSLVIPSLRHVRLLKV